MANPITRAQVTFGNAARAAGLPEKTLRNWLDRGQVLLEGDDEREGGNWRRFSVLDVIRLAIIGRLVAYGLTVTMAYELVADTVDNQTRALIAYRNTPPRALAAILSGITLAVHKGPADEVHVIVGHTADRPADTSDLQDFLFIRAGLIATAVLDRLAGDAEPAE